MESKLQRIENLDKAVEHLMRRVEALDSRVNDNIDKTDAVITKLRTLDLKLFNSHTIEFSSTESAFSARTIDDKNDSEIRSGMYVYAMIMKYINNINNIQLIIKIFINNKQKLLFNLYIKYIPTLESIY